ncbi:MAG: STAS domain-containing protein [Candidatus Eremiobacteraeota bacterium]|nr:STAS domain-containing protein [Candidatus Eremiobacteraeota bacterium]
MNEVDESVRVVALSGELDVARRPEVERAFAMPADSRPVLVDLTHVSYADSTIISSLFQLSQTAPVLERRFAVLVDTPQIVRLFEYAGLGHVLPVFAERTAALQFLAVAGDEK